MRPTNLEAVVHLDDVVPAGGRGLRVSNLLQQLDLIDGRLGVVTS